MYWFLKIDWYIVVACFTSYMLLSMIFDSTLKIQTIWVSDSNFPIKFHSIKPKIKQINYLGDFSLLYKPTLGIVWPRKASEYGSQVVHALFEQVKQYYLVTVSGMAQGIDQLCHNLSIAHQVPTIAVLGGGIARYMRSRVRHVVEKIVKSGGLVLSEFDNETEPTHYTFPQRNRIIAGLADVLFVPEASQRSGSLITVECALQMQKPVFAAPNSIFLSSSEGINHLLQNKKINAIHDMQQFLSLYFSKKQGNEVEVDPSLHLSDKEIKIVSLLWEKNECSIQELVGETWFAIWEMIGVLTMLEMQKCIYQTLPGNYSLRVK